MASQSVNVPTFEEEAMDEISRRLAELPQLSRQQLLDLWRNLYRRPAPVGLRREVLVPFLAYRIQENAYGGLTPSIRAELRRIARLLEPSRGPGKCPVRARVKPGTRIVRTWRGAAHEIFVADSGFQYQGTTYRSLSGIARKITGTRWSGPAFFGLNKTASQTSHSDGR